MFYLLVFRIVHHVHTCITQVAARKQHPCPSNTRNQNVSVCLQGILLPTVASRLLDQHLHQCSGNLLAASNPKQFLSDLSIVSHLSWALELHSRAKSVNIAGIRTGKDG